MPSKRNGLVQLKRWRSLPPKVPSVILALAFVGVGCSGPDIERTTTTPFAELGVREQYRIDGHEQSLVPISAVRLSTSGVLALGQSQDGKVVLFDASDGGFLGSVGRRGEGPGEFRAITNIGWVGDTLWVYDRPMRRLSFATVTPATASDPAQIASSMWTVAIPGLRPSQLVAVYPDRTMLVLVVQSDREFAQSPRHTDRFVRMSFDEEVSSVIAEFDADPEKVVVSSSDPVSVAGFMAPWVLRNQFGAAPDPTRLLAVRTESPSPRGVSLIVEIFGPLGDREFSSSLALEGITLPQALADSVIRAKAEGISASARRRFPAYDLPGLYMDAISAPPVYPVVESAVLGNSGGVWVRVARAKAMEPETYIWVDRSGGDAVGQLLLPQGRIVAADGDMLWVVERDLFDVESVVTYQVRR